MYFSIYLLIEQNNHILYGVLGVLNVFLGPEILFPANFPQMEITNETNRQTQPASVVRPPKPAKLSEIVVCAFVS
jgi:hypothetical protein